MDDAQDRLRRAIGIADEIGDQRLKVRATSILGAVLGRGFKSEEAVTLLQAALSELVDGDEEDIATLKLELARAHHALAQDAQAHVLIEEVMYVAERRGFTVMLAEAFWVKANVLWNVGRRREALAVAEACRSLAEELGLTDLLLRQMIGSGAAQDEVDLAVSVDAHLEIIALARRTGRRAELLAAVGNLAYTCFASGDWDVGLAEAGVLLDEEMAARDRLIILTNVNIIRASRGESLDAMLTEMESLGSGMGSGWHAFVADPTANAQMARGDYKQAAQSYLEVVGTDPGQGPEFFYRAARAELLAGDLAGGTRT